MRITLSLPEDLLRRFRVFAAKRRFLETIRNAPERGTKGKIEWTRDELHER
jgi:hypothetical protein